MNIEEQIKIVKNMLLHAETQLLDYEAIAIETLLTAYEEKCKELEKEKEKNKKLENELEKHIKFCEQEAKGSLHNEICHISLKFNKKLLNILKEEE